jgi:hypothetical protein
MKIEGIVEKIQKTKQAYSFIREFRVSTYRGRIKDGNTRYHETLAEIFRIYFHMGKKKVHLTLPGVALLFQLHFCGWHVMLAAI